MVGNWIIDSAWRPPRSQAQRCLSSGNRDPDTGLTLKTKTSGPRGHGGRKAEAQGCKGIQLGKFKIPGLGQKVQTPELELSVKTHPQRRAIGFFPHINQFPNWVSYSSIQF